MKIEGKVVLMKKNVLDFNDLKSSVLDRVYELIGKGVSLQLIKNEMRGKIGEPAYLEAWITTITPLHAGDSAYKVTFEWDEADGVPGAFIIKNFHHSQFYLKSLILECVPGIGRLHFVCNSWVYPAKHYNHDRIFFTNQSYLPCNTPEPLRKYREEELVILRGDGTGERKEWDRIYDYALYNDLGDPDKGPEQARPVLEGLQSTLTLEEEEPAGHLQRQVTNLNSVKQTILYPDSESRLPLYRVDIYVPRDERFGHLRVADFLGYAVKALVQLLVPEGTNIDSTPNEFDNIQDVTDLYEKGFKLPAGLRSTVRDYMPSETIRELLRTDGENLFRFPIPQVIKEDKLAWRTDEEFAREMLAGLNPVCICLLEEFPPTSKLDPDIYGDQNSQITREHIEEKLEGLTVEEALQNKKLFILDNHDITMTYLNRIHSNTSTKTYATRTFLFLKEDGTLKLLAIELSLPNQDGEHLGAVSKIYMPAEDGVEGSIWQLAKAYVGVVDTGIHQLISHWLHTHATMEPFIIATNRQLSVVHPINKLLHPHFKDTMNINALARQTLLNVGGALERTVFPGRYSVEISSTSYKNWVFTEQALPADLIKRGMAVPDETSDQKHGLRLTIEDYPYAVDGLEVWSAIETWVHKYCSLYYPSDELIQTDTELQLWWSEIVTVGHGDKKDEPWWPKMQTLKDLTLSCTTIIWVASALHAAINFGQYPYGGYLPNRPSISRRLIPEPGTPEHDELGLNPEKAFLKTITNQFQTVLGITLIEILSKHASDEVYLGQRDTADWTSDKEALKAFMEFGHELVQIENRIIERNEDKKLKNRYGPAKMPYTLLYPNTSDHSRIGGLTGRGIPNSVTI
ncbi:hypothetical protein Sjap_007898 [Stephania japonica]|uniref:Lipoxygenase n=1 Tax=Stephania japonica TaxID=461633 RepID=A0AAP0PBS1_9MAGN